MVQKLNVKPNVKHNIRNYKKLIMKGGSEQVQGSGIWGWVTFIYSIYAFIMLNLNSVIIVLSLFIVNAILVGIQKLTKTPVIGPIIKGLKLPKNVFDMFGKMIISFF